MSIQLRLPVFLGERRRDPHDRLVALRRDMETARTAIKTALDELADRHSIDVKDIEYAMEDYADSLLWDAVYGLESELEREIEAQDPV